MYVELVLRVVLAGVLGGLIGAERQWRARGAGLRTNLLVAMGSGLFVVLSAHGFEGDGDPTRVAAQIVSGIGFLGAGVILREGFTIRGLDTAATLWCASAVGSLAGAGLWAIASAGALLVVGANTGLRPLGRALDRARSRRRTRYVFQVTCEEEGEVAVRRELVKALTHPDLRLRRLITRDTHQRGQAEINAIVDSFKRDESLLETATAKLSLEPAVSSVSWSVEDDHEDDDDA